MSLDSMSPLGIRGVGAFGRSDRRRRRRCGGGILVCVAVLLAVPVEAQRIARLDPTEPIFTERAFLDQSIEFDTVWSKDRDGSEVEISTGLEWIFWERIELSAEVPFAISIPDEGSNEVDLSDIGMGAQALLCCDSSEWLDFLSLRGEVDVPTGDRSKGIGGDGSWSVALLSGRYFKLTEMMPDVLAQAELSYEQQIRLDDDQLETAEELSISQTRQKELGWNLALSQQYAGGVIQPVFELLGTTVVDALIGHDEGTIFELGFGLWLAPHPDEHWFSPLSFALGLKLPVTNMKEDQSVAVFRMEWALE